PEQAAELPADGRTDQYALALIAYEMLTGSRPFHSHDVLALLEQQRTQPPPHPRQFVPEISERVAAALLRALSKDPAARFASCKEFAAAIGCALPEGALLEPEILLEANVYARTRLILAHGQAHLLLTRDVLWIGRGDEVREVPIAAIERVQPLWGGRTLEIRFRTEAGRGELRRYDFPSARERDQWHAGLEQATAPGGLTRHDAVAKRRGRPMPLVPQSSDIRYQVLGHLTAAGRSMAACEAGLRIRARMLDADAVMLADSVDQRWANATYSEDTRRTLERHRLIRSTIGSPFGAIRSVVQRLSGLAGQVGADEPSTERLSGIAVRAVNPGERLALAASGLRPQVAKLGIWMLAALAVWFFLAKAWPIHTLGTRNVATMRVFPSLAQRVPESLLAAWPLFIALVLCVRKSGQTVAKSAVTFTALGTTRAAYLLLGAAGERLVLGRTWLGLVLHVVLACVLALIGIAAWRVARRFHRIVGVDGSARLSRLDVGAWLFTLLFVVYCTRVFFGWAR
ncbi:MAG TPA: hypothetical protein VGX76_24045, partial [Pirellulales bacterium]|nr:hypothetical protein [Pirellulales bacterium]